MCVGPPNSYANVMLNVTGLNATQTTFLTVYASGSALPNVSNINLAPGDVRPNLVYSKMDANGCINVFNSVGSVDVLVDVLGYTSSTGTSKFAPVPSTRIVDSRTNMGTVGAWASNENRFVTIAQASNNPVVPAGATYALVNITATSTLATGFTPGFATIYNGNGTPPATSTLNYPTVGTATNNHAIVPLNYGAFRIFNASGGSTNFIVDVEGYYY